MSIEIAANNGLDHSVLIAILSSLDVKNRVVCSNVCEAWKEACDSDRIWEKSHFRLSEPDEAKMCESAAKNYGSMMVEAHFEINQSYIDNRRSLFCIFRSLARIKRKRLRSIKTSFIGVNPLFYKSTSSIESLVEFLGGIGNESWDKIGLINIDLSGFNVALNDTVVDVITQNHPNLRSLDL